MKKILNAIAHIDNIIVPLIVVAIFADVMLQVIGRVTPGSSFSWTVEMGQILLGALIWLGISVGIREHTHVSFSLLIEKFSPRMQKIIIVFDNAMFIFYLCCLVYFSYNMISTYFELGKMSNLLSVNIGYLRLPMLAGTAFGAIVLLVRVINDALTAAKNGKQQ